MNHIEEPRKNFYKLAKLLFQGKHAEAFNIAEKFIYFNGSQTLSLDYLIYNFPKISVSIFTDLIWGANPVFKFKEKKNQDWFEKWIEEEQLLIKFRQATEQASFAGDAILNIRLENKKVLLDIVEPDLWTPEFNSQNPNRPASAHNIESVKTVDKTEYKLVERHEVGAIEYKAFKKEKDKWIETSFPDAYPEIYKNLQFSVKYLNEGKYKVETNVTKPLVFHLPNYKIAGEFFGTSDLNSPTIAKTYNLNLILNQIQYVLRKHANPKMVVPKELISQVIREIQGDETNQVANNYNFTDRSLITSQERTVQEELVASAILKKIEFFGQSIGDNREPKYLTWNAQLEENRKQIDTLKELLFEEGRLAKVLVNPEIATGQLTGIAIKRLSQTSLNKASKKIMYLERCIKDVIYTALELNALVNGDTVAEYPTIEFKPGLVVDLKEVIQEQEMMLANKLTTQKQAIQVVQNTDNSTAESIQNEIRKEDDIFNADTSI
jgi:hypothetical protein